MKQEQPIYSSGISDAPDTCPWKLGFACLAQVWSRWGSAELTMGGGADANFCEWLPWRSAPSPLTWCHWWRRACGRGRAGRGTRFGNRKTVQRVGIFVEPLEKQKKAGGGIHLVKPAYPALVEIVVFVRRVVILF